MKLTEGQRLAVNAICNYNNFVLFSEGADGKPAIVINASKDVFVESLRTLAENPTIGDILTDIVIDYHNENDKCKARP